MVKMEYTLKDLQTTFSSPCKEVAEGSDKIGSLSGRWLCVKMLGDRILLSFSDLANRVKLLAVSLFELFSEILDSRKKVIEKLASSLDTFTFLVLYPFTTIAQIARLFIGCTVHPGVVLKAEHFVNN